MLFTGDTHVIRITRIFFRKLNLRVSKTALKNELYYHKDYPSISSIADVLNFFNVDNITVSIPPDKLSEVPLPAIAHIKKSSTYRFVVIDKITEEHVYLTDESGKKKKISFNEFINIWNKVLLIVELNNKSGENHFDYSKNRKFELAKKYFLFFSIGVSLITAIIFFASINAIQSYQILLKVLGLLISYSLFQKQFKLNVTWLNNICQIGSNLSCEKTLNHPSAKIFGIINLSDAAIIYYSGSLVLMLLTNVLSVDIQAFLSLLAAASVLVTLYTLYSQWFIIKKWCPLCLMLTMVIWLEFLIVYSDSIRFNYFPTIGIGIPLFIFSLFTILWFTLRDRILAYYEIPALRRTVNKFKKNTLFFKNILKNGISVNRTTFEYEIYSGKEDSENCIILISQPDCPLCYRAHRFLSNLNDPDIKIIYRFLVHRNNTESISYQFVSKLLALRIYDSNKTAVKALEDWYNSTKLNKLKTWKNKYQQNNIKEDKIIINDFILEHEKWCEINNIKSTPAFILNFKKIPEEFTISDLKYHLKNAELIR